VSVLLVGPPGSGRQQTASAIHYAGDAAAAGPLVPLACSLLGPDVMRSTLDSLRRLPPQLVGGTLLLSQADQLLPEIQGDLVEVFSGKTFSLRLMATAEQPLRELARRGRYREDLASLLSTLVIELPPLASRREDLPLLAQLFLEEINARGGKQLGGFTPEALDRLDGYAWPGNVDELVQVVMQCHERACGPLVRPEDLPEQLRWAAEPSVKARRKDETIVLDEYLGRIERELIRRALGRAKGNKAKAARLLGLTRPRLYRRMVQLGLEENGGRGPT
jgi:DNA-binding NtrC family response regulator